MEISEIDIKSFPEVSLTMIRERALNNGIQVYTLFDSDLITIRADQRKLGQVMYNLLSNAAKFTPDGGEVTSSARKAEVDCRRVCLNDGAQILSTIQNRDYPDGSAEIERRQCVEFVVADNGIGIKASDRERFSNDLNKQMGPLTKNFREQALVCL